MFASGRDNVEGWRGSNLLFNNKTCLTPLNNMKRFYKKRFLIFYLPILVFLSPVNNIADTPSDEELLKLEQQIKHQEAEQEKAKQRAAEEARRKAEEQKLREEHRKLEEEKQVILEKQKQEEQQHAAEEEKIKEEKLNLLMTNARNAEHNKNFDLAINIYNDVLKEFPDNTTAISGIERIKSVLKTCESIIGVWSWNNGAKTLFYENGTVKSIAFIIKSEGDWKCIDPEKRIFTFNTWSSERKIIMSEDHMKIESIDATLGTKITADKLSDDPY